MDPGPQGGVENTLSTNGGFDPGPSLPENLLRPLPPLPPPPALGSLKDKLAASNLPPPPPPPPPASSVALSPGAGTNTGAKNGRRKKTPDAPPADAISVETLRAIKEHAGFRDETLAEMLGISRPTLANIMKGKTYCQPSAERRNALLNTLMTHLTALTNAYKEIVPT